MTQACRLPVGGRIRRDRPLSFTFDGSGYIGFEGDTLASALLANGVHLIGRSFKYHRPRGIVTAGSEEPNALVTVDRGHGRTTPNLRATQVPLVEGLRASSQNRWPSLQFDLGSFARIASPLLSAGFYYKSFMVPAGFWRRVYEPAIRAVAGLGKAPSSPDPDRYIHHFRHCEVLIIGGGPAGLSAALAAAAAGIRVIVCDEQSEFGGSLLSCPDVIIEGQPALQWLAETLAKLRSHSSVLLLPRTTAFGCFADNFFGLAEQVADYASNPAPSLPRERLWHIRTREVVFATGAIEQPIVFPNNDRPGIILAGAARTYLKRYGVVCGKRAVVVTATDPGYEAAFDLKAAGVDIPLIADIRSIVPEHLLAGASRLGITVSVEATITGSSGRTQVRLAKISKYPNSIPCDLVLMSGGFAPNLSLFCQGGGKPRFDDQLGCFLPATHPAHAISAGACNGHLNLVDCLVEGYASGEVAARWVRGLPTNQHTFRTSCLTHEDDPQSVHRTAVVHPKAFVDFQNDVTTKDLQIAVQEGFRSSELMKRYTTAGMGTDQGKTSGLNTFFTAAQLTRVPVADVGLTTFRMPYTPVSFGALAGTARGHLFDPVRLSPIHRWAEKHGALFEDVGTWKRARFFPVPGEDMAAAVVRECLAVRSCAGIFDASTLGKIEVTGPDAGEFLDRMYTGRLSTLTSGRCRYAMLLQENGFVLDDGIVARLALDRFHITTTTGGINAVLHHMEDYAQTEYTDLSVWLTPITEQWAVIAVQGPLARDIVIPFVQGADLATMPHMSVRQAHICGVPGRIFRVSFTGELGFELNVPSAYGACIWERIFEAGAPVGLTPYGTETMHVLRAEKGYIVVGQETDGTVTPDDLGMNWMIGRDKHDFAGKRSLQLPDLVRHDRKQLVGLLTSDPHIVLEEGVQIIAEERPQVPCNALGHVASAYWSATLGRSIALGLISNGRRLIGQTLFAAMPHGTIRVTLSDHCFYDPENTRVQQAKSAVVQRVPESQPPAFPVEAFEIKGVGVVIRPTDQTERIAIRANEENTARAGVELGVLLGTAPCRATTGVHRTALWLGPDEWLVLAPQTHSATLANVRESLAGLPISLVDVSHRYVGMEVTGPAAADCLNTHCALDLDESAFPPGMCTRTVLAKAEVVLWRTGREAFHLEINRSYAPYVRDCLAETARDCAAHRATVPDAGESV